MRASGHSPLHCDNNVHCGSLGAVHIIELRQSSLELHQQFHGREYVVASEEQLVTPLTLTLRGKVRKHSNTARCADEDRGVFYNQRWGIVTEAIRWAI